jgi:hypothetical protein
MKVKAEQLVSSAFGSWGHPRPLTGDEPRGNIGLPSSTRKGVVVRRFLATLLISAIAAVAAVGSATAARPFDAGERLCTAQGGLFYTFGYGYDCFYVSSISEGDLRAARKVCENLYGGVFFFFGSYNCTVRPV